MNIAHINFNTFKFNQLKPIYLLVLCIGHFSIVNVDVWLSMELAEFLYRLRKQQIYVLLSVELENFKVIELKF